MKWLLKITDGTKIKEVIVYFLAKRWDMIDG